MKLRIVKEGDEFIVEKRFFWIWSIYASWFKWDSKLGGYAFDYWEARFNTEKEARKCVELILNHSTVRKRKKDVIWSN